MNEKQEKQIISLKKMVEIFEKINKEKLEEVDYEKIIFENEIDPISLKNSLLEEFKKLTPDEQKKVITCFEKDEIKKQKKLANENLKKTNEEFDKKLMEILIKNFYK